MKFNSLLFLLLLLPIMITAQSPWTPGNKGQYHQLSFTTLPAYDKLHTSGDAFELERSVTDNTLQYYSEIGIGDQFSATLILPFKMLKAGELTDAMNINPISTNGNLSALGDIQVVGKYQFLKKENLVIAASFLVGLPTSKAQDDTGLRSGFKALQLSPGISIGTGKEKFYTYGFVNYNYYAEDFASSVYAGAEFGWKFTPSFILAAHLSTVVTLDDGSNVPTLENLSTGLYLNGFEFTALQLKLMKEFSDPNLGVFLSLGGGTGNLVAQALAISFGVYLKI